MKKKLLSLLIASLALTGCTIVDQTKGSKLSDDEEELVDDNYEEEEDEKKDEEEDEHHEQEHHEEEHHEDGDYQYSLNDYTNFYWHDGHKPCFAPDWEYHIKDTVNPQSSAFWENPNESVDYSGVVFKDRNSYIISPTFKSWKKVEIKFTFWFSNNNKEASKDNPQMYIEEYSSSNQLLGKQEVKIARNEVPKDNNPLKRTYYIRNTFMSYFILRHNNYVYNGNNASFYVVLSEARLKGWDYE